MFDLIIIGGGPSGMTCAIYAHRAGRSVLILEKGMIGGQVALTTNIENYPSYKKINGADLALSMFDQVSNLQIETKFEEVISCDLKGDVKVIKTPKNTYEAKAVYIATGASSRLLNIDNEKKYIGKGISYCATCDGSLYKNKDVAVVGGGNASFEDCLYLCNVAHKVYLIHRRDEFRGDKITLDKLNKLKDEGKIEFIQSSVVNSLIGDGTLSQIEVLNNKTEEKKQIDISALFVAIGRKPDTEIYDGLKLNEKGYIIVNSKKETNISGVYAGGDVSTTQLRQIITACSDGAIASSSINEYLSDLNK